MRFENNVGPRTGTPGDKLIADLRIVSAIVIILSSVHIAAQTKVKDVSSLDGMKPLQVRGVGLMTGLNGTGDSPKSETMKLLKNYVAQTEIPQIGDLTSKNVALVSVIAEIPAGSKAGSRIDVKISAIGDAKSLTGGTLLMTPLRSPGAKENGGGVIYAVAQGPAFIDTGNPLGGSILAGAALRKDVSGFENVLKMRRDRIPYLTYNGADAPIVVKPSGKFLDQDRAYFKLNLAEPDPSAASALAAQINDQALHDVLGFQIGKEATIYRQIATAVDAGSVEVIIPNREEYFLMIAAVSASSTDPFRVLINYPGFVQNPVPYIEKILEMEFAPLISQKARVIISTKSKSIAITGPVMVKEGMVMRGKVRFTIPQRMRLKELLEKDQVMAVLTDEQVVDLIKGIYDAGLIEGTVELK